MLVAGRSTENSKLGARGTRSTTSSVALHVFDLGQHQLSFLELPKGKVSFQSNPSLPLVWEIRLLPILDTPHNSCEEQTRHEREYQEVGGKTHVLNATKWNFMELHLKDGIKCRIRTLSRAGILPILHPPPGLYESQSTRAVLPRLRVHECTWVPLTLLYIQSDHILVWVLQKSVVMVTVKDLSHSALIFMTHKCLVKVWSQFLWVW